MKDQATCCHKKAKVYATTPDKPLRSDSPTREVEHVKCFDCGRLFGRYAITENGKVKQTAPQKTAG